MCFFKLLKWKINDSKKRVQGQPNFFGITFTFSFLSSFIIDYFYFSYLVAGDCFLIDDIFWPVDPVNEFVVAVIPPVGVMVVNCWVNFFYPVFPV